MLAAPILERWVNNPNTLIEDTFTVATKSGKTARFNFNPIQRVALGRQARRNIYLKPRQVGMSTFLTAQRLARVLTRPNWTAVSIAHDDKTTQLLFDKVRYWYNRQQEAAALSELEIYPIAQYSNRKELYFPGLNSRYIIFTAGNKNGIGRGATVNDLHGSEVAFWPHAESIIGGLMESVPSDAYIDLESTANGAGGFFFETCEAAKRGDNQYTFHFFEWWLQPEYQLTRLEALEKNVKVDEPLTQDELYLKGYAGLTLEQIYWRRWKQKELKRLFPQEYPESDIECFLTSGNTYFDTEVMKEARAIGQREPVERIWSGALQVWLKPEKDKEYLISADVAEGIATGDACAAFVLDSETGEDCALLHGRWNPHKYAALLRDLSQMYNSALIAPERNNHGHAVLTELLYSLGCSERVYLHTEYDAAKVKSVKKAGWPTTAKTKPLMLSTLHKQMENAPELFHSKLFFDEALVFVENSDGSIGAIQGAHDDTVMARAIGSEILAKHKKVKKRGRVY